MGKCFEFPENLENFKGSINIHCYGCCDNNSDGNSGTLSDFTIIYPNGGDRDNPALVTTNSRYVEDNPFPGHEVLCRAEVLINGNWGITGWLCTSENRDGVLSSHLFPSDQIVVQTGDSFILPGNSSASGNPFGTTGSATVKEAPCRVKVWKLNKIKD